MTKAVDSLIALGKWIQDSWFNPFTGFGTGRDKTSQNRYMMSDPIPDEVLTALFNDNDIANKVVSIWPDEMFREGYLLATGSKETDKAISERGEYLKIGDAFHDAKLWANLYGGAVIFVGANDGLPADTPLNIESVRSIDFLDVFDRRQVWPWRNYANSTHPCYGHPEIYQIQSFDGRSVYVHASRLIIFRGQKTDKQTQQNLNGWDFSILQNKLRIIEGFDEVFQAARIMMTEASIGVFTMKGLVSMIAGGQRQLLETRAQTLDLGKSVARSLFLDADNGENYRRESIPMTGVGDQLVQAAKRLSAATDIPVIVLMGETPSGLNASGDANVRLWYDRIHAKQNKEIIPPMLWTYQLIGRTLGYQGEITLEAKPLWQETPKEQAERRNALATADNQYISNEVYTPEEVAAVRGKAKGWDGPIIVDLNNRLGSFLEKPPELPGNENPNPVLPA